MSKIVRREHPNEICECHWCGKNLSELLATERESGWNIGIEAAAVYLDCASPGSRSNHVHNIRLLRVDKAEGKG